MIQILLLIILPNQKFFIITLFAFYILMISFIIKRAFSTSISECLSNIISNRIFFTYNIIQLIYSIINFTKSNLIYGRKDYN
jgi:hypothetical protein